MKHDSWKRAATLLDGCEDRSEMIDMVSGLLEKLDSVEHTAKTQTKYLESLSDSDEELSTDYMIDVFEDILYDIDLEGE